MADKEEEYKFESFQEYRDYLDEPPEEDWIQKRSLGGSKIHEFIPVFITNGNADVIFREWNVVDEKYMSIENGVTCTVKIFALPDYPGAQQITFTGTAAIPFKSTKNAIEYDVPNSRERAIAKAFATLGNVFGRNLNRTYLNSKGNKKTVSRDFSFIRKAKETNE